MSKKTFLHHLLPENKEERILLCLLMLFYFAYSCILILQTTIIDNIHPYYDLYFSFDNVIIYKSGYQSIPPHPLMKYFTKPIIIIGDSLAVFTGYYKAKTFLWVIFCNYMIASSALFVFKYLKKVISLNNKISILITIIFAITPINLVLCFTPESFTISVYIITFVLYYTAYHIKSETDMPIFEKAVLSISATGITLTNFIICTIPYLFSKKPFKGKLKDLAILSGLMGIIMIWIGTNLITDTETRLEMFTHTTGRFYEQAIDLFWGSPLLSPELWIHRAEGLNVISMGYYHSGWQYLFIIIITGLVLLSFIKNYNNKFVHILFLILIFNIFIHVVIKYGLEEPFMYSAHWISIIPLLLGWLYNSVSTKKQNVLYSLYVLIFIAMLTNNICHLYDFIRIAIKLYPV